MQKNTTVTDENESQSSKASTAETSVISAVCHLAVLRKDQTSIEARPMRQGIISVCKVLSC